MKKTVFLAGLMMCVASIGFGQKLKDKMNQMAAKANGEATADGSMPKGVEIYNIEHSDKTGMSGKYYLLNPIYIEVKGKGFQMGEVTLEYRPEMYNGVLHWINDEVTKEHRYLDADMSKLADFYPPTGVASININLIDKFGNYSFAFANTSKYKKGKQNQSFMEGAKIIRYSQDPDILIISNAKVFESQNCIPRIKEGDTYDAIKVSNSWSFAQQFNVLSKDPEKLNDWDSTKLMEVALEASVKLCSDVTAASADVRGLPKQGIDNDALEKELFALIKPMATADKPIAWGDKMQYVYLHTDWKVYYQDAAKTIIDYRTCIAIAVSSGWPVGEGRYIAVHVKQNHNGSDYSPMELGFGGSLIPVSKDKITEFKH